MADPVAEYLSTRADRNAEGCLVWRGAKGRGGYGSLRANGRNWVAHRYVLHLAGVVVPDGLEVDHLCRNRACVEPSHLDVVSKSENTRRALNHLGNIRLNADECIHGHAFTEENTYLHPKRKNRYGLPTRSCRKCMNEASARSKARRSAR